MSNINEMEVREVEPYSVLAAGYDVVMEHVDYLFWAEYVQDQIQQFGPGSVTILELGCGTGSLALELAPLGPYQYLGTDAVEMMVRVARAKADSAGAGIQFEVADFTNYRVDQRVDVVILLYDGLNYLLEEDGIRGLMRCTFSALKPGGLFILDQSTPLNSINNEAFFEDEGETDDFSYRRTSRYDQEMRLHKTTFEMCVCEQTYKEQHVQRAYELSEVAALVDECGFDVIRAFDGFTSDPANAKSERIHWIIQKPS